MHLENSGNIPQMILFLTMIIKTESKIYTN